MGKIESKTPSHSPYIALSRMPANSASVNEMGLPRVLLAFIVFSTAGKISALPSPYADREGICRAFTRPSTHLTPSAAAA